MRDLAHVDPLYHTAEATRLLSAGTIASWTVGQAFLVMAALTAITLTWATRTHRNATTSTPTRAGARTV